MAKKQLIELTGSVHELFTNLIMSMFDQTPDKTGNRERVVLVYSSSFSKAGRKITRLTQDLSQRGFNVVKENNTITLSVETPVGALISTQLILVNASKTFGADTRGFQVTDAFVSVNDEEYKKISKTLKTRVGRSPAGLKSPYFIMRDKQSPNG